MSAASASRRSFKSIAVHRGDQPCEDSPTTDSDQEQEKSASKKTGFLLPTAVDKPTKKASKKKDPRIISMESAKIAFTDGAELKAPGGREQDPSSPPGTRKGVTLQARYEVAKFEAEGGLQPVEKRNSREEVGVTTEQLAAELAERAKMITAKDAELVKRLLSPELRTEALTCLKDVYKHELSVFVVLFLFRVQLAERTKDAIPEREHEMKILGEWRRLLELSPADAAAEVAEFQRKTMMKSDLAAVQSSAQEENASS